MALSQLYVSKIYVKDTLPKNTYYAKLPMIQSLKGEGLNLVKPVTVLVGENGIGKSTLMEAIAVSLGFNPEGGTKNFNFHTEDSHSDLWKYITVGRSHYFQDGFFFRAESFYNFASYIDQNDRDPDNLRDGAAGIIRSYGGTSLHRKSHGESFLTLVRERLGGHGIYIFDEPEAALSPASILTLMVEMDRLIKNDSQLVIATHSPILMAFPNADILQMTEKGIQRIPYYETEHFQLTKAFVNDPEHMFRYLFEN